MEFILSQSNEALTTHAGLALIGRLLAKTHLRERLNQTQWEQDKNFEISNAEVVCSYLGLLSQGKSDFDHIEPFRCDQFFPTALECQRIPSAPTLRQRFDAFAASRWGDIIREESASLLKRMKVTLTPALRDLIPLDVDVSPFDNSDSKKEGVELTYKKVAGYAPIFFYLGKEGYLVDEELRPGSTHSQAGTPTLLKRVFALARLITASPLLLRTDAGHDSIDNFLLCHQTEGVEYIIKHNLRSESPEKWRDIAQVFGALEEPRPGKKVWIGSQAVEMEHEQITFPVNVVFRVTERRIDKNGQALLVPDLEVEVWYTSLPDDAKTIIRLYEEHGTMEQFHSELKTELDLERLPSGKFATNALVLDCGMLAYNLLKLIGQESLTAASQPLRKKVSRRRIRTVIQNLIMLAARLVYHARRWKLSFGRDSSWFLIFKHVYLRFA